MTGAGDGEVRPRMSAAASLGAGRARSCALVVAALVTSLVLLRHRRRRGRLLEHVCSRWPSAATCVNILNRRRDPLPVRRRRGDRLPDEPVQHRRRGPVPRRASPPPPSPAQAWLPGTLNTVVAILVAMLAGALWAGIAGVLRVTRGVSEVISTIMLNAIAVSLVGYFLTQVRRQRRQRDRAPSRCPRAAGVGGITLFADSPDEASTGSRCWRSWSASAFWVLLNRTRFGFDLRAAGASETRGGRERRQREEDGRLSRCCSPARSPG